MTPASPTTGPVVAAQGLTLWFGADKAVDGVDLTVVSGEIHALVGLNGAGKTTLMKMLLGMLRPDAGTARLFGEPVGDAGPEVWSQVGHLLETPFGYGELTPTENVIAAARLHGVDVSAARRQAGDDRRTHPGQVGRSTQPRPVPGEPAAPRAGLRAGPPAAAADPGRTDQRP